MQQISELFATLLNRWTASFAGIAVAGMLVWYLGPLVPGLAGPLPRALMILVALLAWGAVNGVIGWRRRRREHILAAGVTDADGNAGHRDAKGDAADEVGRLRERLDASLKRLRGNRRRGFLYEQPWFVLIGPPGSGKTTALLNSGLHFPDTLEDDTGRRGAESIGGVGGTRLCDWWFADEAVLIDTAGRYTTQDSDAGIDRAGWHGFLDLLRHTRPRQPINGVIVVISLADIATAAAPERTAHARAIRRRINEIRDRLQMRVPVYVVFSKADRLAGFGEYFDDLDAEARAQVWGMTLPLANGVERFETEFRLLLERLDARLLERLQAERAPDRRVLIAGFPLQVASLAQPLGDFMNQAFTDTRLDPAPFLRGVYLSSATQEGTPIDQLTGLLARSFGIDQKRGPSLRPVAGRGYFLRRAIREVILGEALLVSLKSAGQRRRRWLRGGGFAATGLACLAAALMLWRAEAINRQAVAQAAVALSAYRAQLSGLPLDPVGDDDLPRVAPALDAVSMPPHDGGFWHTGIAGLSQGAKLRQVDRLVYRDALQQILLPRLVWRLEAQMRGRFGDPDFLYEATQVYLMLGGAGPLDRNLVRSWEALDWQARFPGALNASLRDRLARHLDALLAEPLPALILDGGLVGAARTTFSRVPLADRVYSRIRADAAPGAVPDWTPAEALGPGGAPVFTRSSGKPLTEGIPGFYTPDGFRTLLLGHLAETTRTVAGESWVLGREQVPPQETLQVTPQGSNAGPDEATLEQAVVARYVADYEKQWDGLLDDIVLASPGHGNEVVQRLYVLSSPQSPVRDLLVAITHQLTLREPVDAKPAGSPSQARLAAVIATPAAAGAPSTAASADAALARHYAGLRTLVGEGQPAAPLDGLLHLIDALQTRLAQAGRIDDAAVPAGGDPVQLLLAEAQRQPAPVAGWLRQVADSGRTALSGTAAAAASTAFSAATGPADLCRQVVHGHYPFVGGSGQDAPLDDFSRLFAPDGRLDSFFQARIKPYVDMSGPVWRPRIVDGAASPVDAATVARFQRAAAIRDAFFPTGGSQPQIRFTLTPLPPDPAARATLTLNGTAIATATSLSWPATGAAAQASLGFDPADGAPPIRAAGDWALFRLLDQAGIRSSGEPGSFAVTFRSGARLARFTLQPGSSRNPFGSRLLAGFQCPAIR